jgi:hypothetical protein
VVDKKKKNQKDEPDVTIEYVAPEINTEEPGFAEFANIFAKFQAKGEEVCVHLSASVVIKYVSNCVVPLSSIHHVLA